jgi:predicted RNase H-like HicB family nuclease
MIGSVALRMEPKDDPMPDLKTIPVDAVAALKVTAFWDPEANVWVAESEDVPGLVVEAESLDKLVPELDALIPILMADNKVAAKLTDHRLHYRLEASIDNSIEIPSAA